MLLARVGGRGEDQAAKASAERKGRNVSRFLGTRRKALKQGSVSNLEAQGLSFPRLRRPLAGSPCLLSHEDTGFESTLSMLLTQSCILPGP